jgi:hypothetical protein
LEEKSFNSIIKGLNSMGYKSANESHLSQDDLRIGYNILQHPTRSRVDIFKASIAHKIVLSGGIKKRAKSEIHGNLKLGVLSNEDVFPLKGVILREGDIEDMAKLAQSPRFDWKIVCNELHEQEHGMMDMRFSSTLLESLDDIYDHKGIRAPFYKQLV